MKGVKGWAMDCLKKPKTVCQEGGRTTFGEQMKGVKDWAVNCLKQPKAGDHKGEERKKITLRAIELGSVCVLPFDERIPPRFHLASVKVEEHEVWGADSNGP